MLCNMLKAPNAWTSTFMFGAIIYVVISEIMARVFKIDNARSLKIGIGAFFFSWVMVWVLLHTILSSMG